MKYYLKRFLPGFLILTFLGLAAAVPVFAEVARLMQPHVEQLISSSGKETVRKVG